MPTPQSTVQYRPIFLLVWPAQPFKAHWAIFIPDSTDKTFKQGKYMHVEGALYTGFTLSIVRNWNIDKSRRRPGTPIEIGYVRAELVSDNPTGDRALAKDAEPKDALESLIASTPPPSASLNKVSSGAVSLATSRAKKADLSDCQWWVTQCVHDLVEKGELVRPTKGLNKNKDPRDILEAAPRH